ncbi:hypothetical protein RM543_02140 [Roseicyclus sp. F158]|uniref:DUF2157 domain-containing protein n=1 Tax=Tropicimonas omnivorans TaxID=3075590 RepID=A0ABU3DCN5_9RHOB|nr:hypothetical protein [Roseicyclus sp. F158]MDT0681470.1 hypothetical protein [Roseicyclus sp. F158]
MSVGAEDIRAAVRAGMISEAQAASLMTLADARRGARENLDGLDEPFELFRGFNEIFIVVGLGILYGGCMSVLAARFFTGNGDVIGALALLAGLFGLSVYFTLRRRMVAPSIALVVMTTLTGVAAGASLMDATGFAYRLPVVLGTATLTALVHFVFFRVPFGAAVISLGIIATLSAALIGEVPRMPDLLLLSQSGPAAWITIGVGLCTLVLALRLDLSDPHRVTRRAATAFWLHVVAAPAIVNSVALSLLDADWAGSNAVLLLFVAIAALFAVVIDRRSFLVSGVGYVVALSFTVLDDSAPLAVIALGAGLVLLGAFWERLRAGLMNALPRFPGKDRLPPWTLIASKEAQ